MRRMPPNRAPVAAPMAAPLPVSPAMAPPAVPIRAPRAAPLSTPPCLASPGAAAGGGGLAGQTEEDYRALEGSFTALRHLSRALDDDLRASPSGRLAIVSSTTVARPLAGGAGYAAVKAASEAWTRAVAQGYAKATREAGEPLRTAAVVFLGDVVTGGSSTSMLLMFALSGTLGLIGILVSSRGRRRRDVPDDDAAAA